MTSTKNDAIANETLLREFWTTLLGVSPDIEPDFMRAGGSSLLLMEIQLGLQWNLCCCWFVRGGWQAQYWDDAAEVGSLVRQQDFATLGDIGVHGFNLAVGYSR